MKLKLTLILFVITMIFESLWLKRNIELKDPKIHVIVKVISKFDSPHITKHKHYSEISGIDNTLRVHSDKYGYGDIKVTTNTWMEAEVGKYIPFALSYYKMNEVFDTDLHQPIHEDIFIVGLTIFLSFMIYLIIFLSIILK